MTAHAIPCILLLLLEADTRKLITDEYEKGIKLEPKAAMNGAGAFVIAWADMDHVWAQRFAASGERVGDPIEVDRDIPILGPEPPDLQYPSVSMDGAGNFVVAWESSGASPETHFRVFDGAGTVLGQLTRVNTGRPAVVMVPDGGFALFFRDFPRGGQLFGQSFDLAGQATSMPFPVSLSTRVFRSDASVDAGGRVGVAFEDTRGRDSVFVTALDGPVKAFQVELFARGEAREPAIAMDAEGRIAVVWEENQTIFQNGERLRRSNAWMAILDTDGTFLRGPVLVNLEPSDGASPDVLLNASGDIVVVYSAFRDGKRRILSRRYSLTGDILDDPLWVNRGLLDGERSINPSIAGTPERYVVAWETFLTDAGGLIDRSEVELRLFQRTGDRDVDGVLDGDDNCPDRYNPSQADLDQDGLADGCDPDIDNDTALNAQDNCDFRSNVEQADRDADGVGDVCDNCPDIPSASQVDDDSDGLGNDCDACPFDAGNDMDGDAICGHVDNCPSVPNPTQLDGDSDAIGAACDNCPTTPNPDQGDGDMDGIGDACEAFIRGDADTDGAVGITDAIYTLSYLFAGAPPLCVDAMDANDTGGLDITDPISLLLHLFLGGPPPPPPFPAAGVDPTLDELTCERSDAQP